MPARSWSRSAWRIYRERGSDAGDSAPKQLFAFSVLYLFLLFAVLLVEEVLRRAGLGLMS